MPEARTVLERAIASVHPPEMTVESFWRGRERKRRNERAAVIVVALALSLASAAALVSVLSRPAVPADDAAPAPSNGPLTVFADTGSFRELSLDGRERPRIEVCCPVILDASWSPDGARLAYATGCLGRCRPDPGLGVWVFHTATAEHRLLVRGSAFGVAGIGLRVPVLASVTALDWSPDGSRLAVAAARGGIAIVDVDDATALPIVGADVADSVSWSPDGSEIAYSTRAGQMFVVSEDGGETLALGTGSQPDWSPDGGRLAYRDGCDLWLMASDGTDRSRVASFPMSTWGHGSKTSCRPLLGAIRSLGPVWSPDGTQLAAVFANRTYVIDATSGEARIVQDPIERSVGGIGAGVAWRPIPSSP